MLVRSGAMTVGFRYAHGLTGIILGCYVWDEVRTKRTFDSEISSHSLGTCILPRLVKSDRTARNAIGCRVAREVGKAFQPFIHSDLFLQEHYG